MLDQEINKIEVFFSKVRTFKSNFWEERFLYEKQAFKGFQNRYQVFLKESKALRQKETPYYNIFEVLNIRHRETKLHTPFLVHLLNPEASHEQGALFLDSFLKLVLNLEFQYAGMTNFKIYEEHSNVFGQIDIFIEFNYDGRVYGIVIENKIYAKDQFQQLERYYNYLSATRKFEDTNIILAYLTVNKTSPTPQSINKDLAIRLYNDRILLNIGYKEDILFWIQSCLDKVTSDMVRFTLHQYLKTIVYL